MRNACRGSVTPNLLTAEEFIVRYGDDAHYELIDGELIEMNPTEPHEQVAAFIGRKLNVEIDRQDAPYLNSWEAYIPAAKTCSAVKFNPGNAGEVMRSFPRNCCTWYSPSIN